MQWLWLIPSLAFGVYLYATTGAVYGLVFGGFAALSSLAGAWLQHRRVLVDETAEVRFGAGRVALGNKVLPRREALWKPAWRNRVYGQLAQQNQAHAARFALEHKLQGSLAATDADGLGAWLGFAGQDEVELALAEEGAHAIVVGATGSGKSQLLTTWLVSLCQGFTPAQLQILAIDYKGGAALAGLGGLPWLAGLHTDLGGTAGQALAGLVTELEVRERACAAAGVARIEDLAAAPPRLLVVVDELQSLLQDPAIARPLEAVAARGRSLGVHLLLTAQSLTGVPRGLLANLGVRISVGKADPVDLAQLGYSRTEATSPSAAAPGHPQWGSALLITPNRQLRFWFPSSGLVGFGRVGVPVAPVASVDFQPTDGAYASQNSKNTTESVEKLPEKFVFRIGL